MIGRDEYPPGVPCWIDTAQPDTEAAADFYRGLFGWEFEDRMPPGGPGHYYMARYQGRDVAAVGSLPDDAPPTPAWNTYIAVASADEIAARVTAAGGTVLAGPFDVYDSGRMAMCADPAGARFSLWQAGTHHGAQLVNAPNTWNWSNLATPEGEGATVFYGAVFGWEAATVSFGEMEGVMWRLPGYGDFLERLEPGIRQRQADASAPAGFADCVAWMGPTAGGDDASQWSVTFAVDDTDAMAARTVELGGDVVVPPFDAGPVRVATLRDPQGAVFSVNRYNPG